MSLHFLMLGGLRYNRADLLDLIGRKSMIPLEQLKESSFYQVIEEEGMKKGLMKGREEGREEGELKGVKEMFSLFAASRFPGCDCEAELDRVHDIEALKQLSLELHSLP